MLPPDKTICDEKGTAAANDKQFSTKGRSKMSVNELLVCLSYLIFLISLLYYVPAIKQIFRHRRGIVFDSIISNSYFLFSYASVPQF